VHPLVSAAPPFFFDDLADGTLRNPDTGDHVHREAHIALDSDAAVGTAASDEENSLAVKGQEQKWLAFDTAHQNCFVLIDGQNDGGNTVLVERLHVLCFGQMQIDDDLVGLADYDMMDPIEETQH
jgi:hypothetical protein